MMQESGILLERWMAWCWGRPPAFEPSGRAATGFGGACQGAHGEQNGRKGPTNAQHADQGQVTVRLITPTRPQAAGHRQRQRLPPPSPSQLDPKFVRLHVPQVHPPGLHQMGVQPLAIVTGAFPSGGDGTFIQAETCENGLQWTAMAEQRHQDHRTAQAEVRRAARRRVGRPTGRAAIALLSSTTHADVASAAPPLVAAGVVRAELILRGPFAGSPSQFAPCCPGENMPHAARSCRFSAPITLNRGATQVFA